MEFSGLSLLKFELYDDGAHGDGDAGDGVYGGYLNTKGFEGDYEWGITAEGRGTMDEGRTTSDERRACHCERSEAISTHAIRNTQYALRKRLAQRQHRQSAVTDNRGSNES